MPDSHVGWTLARFREHGIERLDYGVGPGGSGWFVVRSMAAKCRPIISADTRELRDRPLHLRPGLPAPASRITTGAPDPRVPMHTNVAGSTALVVEVSIAPAAKTAAIFIIDTRSWNGANLDCSPLDRPFGAIDDEHFGGTFLRHELEPQLLPDSRKKRRWRRSLIRGPCQAQVEISRESCLIEYSPADDVRERVR
jgi:hypothetical protein